MNILNNLTARTPSVIIDRKDSQTMKMWKSPGGFFSCIFKGQQKKYLHYSNLMHLIFPVHLGNQLIDEQLLIVYF